MLSFKRGDNTVSLMNVELLYFDNLSNEIFEGLNRKGSSAYKYFTLIMMTVLLNSIKQNFAHIYFRASSLFVHPN